MSSDNKLTIDDVKEIVQELNRQRGEVLQLIQNHFLLPQTVLRIGNKIYYSPEIKSGEVTILTLPEEKIVQSAPDIKFF